MAHKATEVEGITLSPEMVRVLLDRVLNEFVGLPADGATKIELTRLHGDIRDMFARNHEGALFIAPRKEDEQ